MVTNQPIHIFQYIYIDYTLHYLTSLQQEIKTHRIFAFQSTVSFRETIESLEKKTGQCLKHVYVFR